MGNSDVASAKSQWRILEGRTRDQSYRLSPLSWEGASFQEILKLTRSWCGFVDLSGLGLRDARMLIFPFLAELFRLDTKATPARRPDGIGQLTSGYDPDFQAGAR